MSSWIRSIGITFGGGCAFALILLTVFWGRNAEPPNYLKQFHRDGFDFITFQSSDEVFVKYSPGLQLPIASLTKKPGDGRVDSSDTRLLLLQVTDPECPFVKISIDVAEELRANLNPKQVRYMPVIFTDAHKKVDSTLFAKSIGFDEVLVWSDENQAPELFYTMATPSHILTDRNGTILMTWFSSSRDKGSRKRMASQILDDVRLIHQTIEALERASR